MLRTILFDVDRVLVDSRKANAEFYTILLEKGDYKRPSPEEIQPDFPLAYERWYSKAYRIGRRS